MEFYHKDDGYPMSISIETMSVDHMDDDTCMYSSIVMDMDTNKVIADFCHDSLLGRKKWAEGFFTALRLMKKKVGKNISAEEILVSAGILIRGDNDKDCDPILDAMEEYASQFRSEQRQVTDEQENKLAEIYLKDCVAYVAVAEICDEVLDKSGALLGRIRDKAKLMKGK